MDAVVIPWFLALTSFAALNNTEIRTDHGPVYEPEPNYGLVYVYDVDIDFTRSPEINIEADYTLNLTSTLKCRARNANVLYCTLDESRVTTTVFKYNSSFERLQAEKESFEIDFDKAGVKSLRVSTSSSSEMENNNKYRLIKIIASQLNVGVDFGKQKSFAFTTHETSSLGECETDFTVMASSCPENATREDFQIRSTFYELLGDEVLLRKRRNTRNCDRPNEVSLLENRQSVVTTETSSYSEMRVCSDFFESLTIVQGKSIIINKNALPSVFQQVVKVRLQNIEIAKEEIPTFAADSATDIIYLHKDVESNDFETDR